MRTKYVGADYEEIEIRAAACPDSRIIYARHAEPDGEIRASVVLMAAAAFRNSLHVRGCRTIAFEPALDGQYDDLVRRDLPLVVECTRARAGGGPVLVVARSFMGPIALAAQGLGLLGADGIVVIGSDVWLAQLDPSRTRRVAKRALAAALPFARLRWDGRELPSRFVRELLRPARERVWSGADGTDYLRALAQVRAPVAAVVGSRDRLFCPPAAGRAFARRCGGPVRVFSAPSGHAALVRQHTIVTDAVEWALAQARP